MINGIMLAWYGSRGGVVGDTLGKWEQAGFFSYLLPFLLIFALVYGILTRANIFKDNKAVNAIISLAVALMALQFDFVPTFFAEIFPRLGVGLAVILIALILLGMFMPSKAGPWIMFVLGAIVLLTVLINTFGSVGWAGGYWLEENWPYLVVAGLVVWAFIAIVNSVGDKKPSDPNDSPLGRALLGKD